MADRLLRFEKGTTKSLPVEVGTRVYEPYAPAKAGIVIADLGPMPPDGYYRNIRVKWLDGQISEGSSGYLNDFDALIADHEKKLKTHLTTREKLDKLKL